MFRLSAFFFVLFLVCILMGLFQSRLLNWLGPSGYQSLDKVGTARFVGYETVSGVVTTGAVSVRTHDLKIKYAKAMREGRDKPLDIYYTAYEETKCLVGERCVERRPMTEMRQMQGTLKVELFGPGVKITPAEPYIVTNKTLPAHDGRIVTAIEEGEKEILAKVHFPEERNRDLVPMKGTKYGKPSLSAESQLNVTINGAPAEAASDGTYSLSINVNPRSFIPDWARMWLRWFITTWKELGFTSIILCVLTGYLPKIWGAPKSDDGEEW